MKKRMNIVFFGLCFLAAMLAETYCIIRLNEDYLSVIGIGMVVLITGYLLMDSLRSKWSESRDRAIAAFKSKYIEEMDKRDVKFIELLNIQKATYSVTKKDGMQIKEYLEAIASKVAALEEANVQATDKIIELQKRAMEGQKNALNIEVNYNKENTKQLLRKLQAIEENTNQMFDVISKIKFQELRENDIEPFIDTMPVAELVAEPVAEPAAEVIKPTPVVKPIYEDPNKALTTDEIAALFASLGQ